MNTKTLLGILPLLIGIPSYAHYIHSVYKRKTTPHMYSWLIWAVLASISFIAQVDAGAGPGAWNTGFTALVCLIVFVLATKFGERKLSKLDVFLLLMALASVLTLFIINNAVIAVLLTTIAACIGFTLTIKKAYREPGQENIITFSLNSVRNLISLFALTSVTFVTFFYPFCIMLANFTVVATVLTRRRKLGTILSSPDDSP